MGNLRECRRSGPAAVAGLAVLVSLMAFSATPKPPQEKAKIEPQLAQRVAGGGETTFWVVLRERADLRPAYAMSDWEARGRFVVQRLQATAHRSQAELRRWLRGRGLEHQPFWIRNAIRVRGDRAALEEVARRAEVETIIADKEYHIPLPMPADAEAPIQTVEWNIAKVGADQVWSAFGDTGQGIVVANIDTGVDPAHEALVNQYRGRLEGGSFDHNYNWFDPSRICSPDGRTPCDNIGHGTHTMGTVVGGDGPGPMANDIGVAPGARWIAAKGCEFNSCSFVALLSSGQWMLAPTDLSGQNPRPDLRPHVVNNSWGGPSDDFFLEIVRAWRASGIFPAFANGNNAFVCGGVSSPGDYLESFGVGATNIFDFSPAFSNRGPSQFVPGLIKPDASAPGEAVRSSVPGNGYAVFSGTSMATPHVAGTVALVWAVAPSLVGDIEATFDLIKRTAVDRIDLSCGGEADGDPNNVYGEGRIDALAAVSESPHSAGTLEGSVVDAVSGAPIGGAGVTAVRRDDGLTRSQLTDAGGAYRLRLSVDPAPGPEIYDATASAFGYGSQNVGGIEISEDVTTSQNFALASLPRFTITGTVRDGAGDPVADASVSVVGTPLAPALTDATGYYTIPGVPAGDYELRAEAGRCQAPASQSVSVSGDRVVDFELAERRDAFGYRCEEIPLDWVDPAPIIPLSGDDSVVEVTLPFGFPLYGIDHSTSFVSTNGYLSLRSPSAIYENTPIPDPSDPNGALYPFWDDLIVEFDSAVRAQTFGAFPDRVWVVEWENVGFYSDPSNRINFEIKLYERDGSLEFLYRSMPGMGDGSSATVGIENGVGSDAFQYSFQETAIHDGLAVRFIPPPPQPSVTLLATTNEGELLEVDYGSGAARLLGDAGVWNGRNLGWSGLSFDAGGTLYVTSRHGSEDPGDGCFGFYGFGPCSHLYVVSPFDGTILGEVGSTHVAFLSDIDFGPDGTLNGAYFLDQNDSGDGALAKIDPSTAQVVFSGRFGAFENGGLSVDPRNGEIWNVESTFSQTPSLFRVDPNTGAAVPPILRLGLNGFPTNFGLDALEILPDGRFVGLRGGIGNVEMYEIAPLPNPVTGLAEMTRRQLDLEPGIAGKPNGLETLSVTLPAFGFVVGRVTDAVDGVPLAGVRVTALENGRSVTTDAEGLYRMQLPAGLHTLEASLAPYASERARVTVVENQATTQNFALRSGRAAVSPASLDFVALSGQVRTQRLNLRNVGLADLMFEVQERSVAAARAATPPPVPEGVDSATPPPDYVRKPSSTVFAGGPVLVFIDVFPWGLDSLFQVLVANNIPFDVATSDLMGTIDLSQYEVVFLSSDQWQPFYDNYNARRTRFVDYVQGGGLLWVGAAAWGANGGSFDGAILPGGMTVRGPVFESLNDVLDASHPTMQGVPNPFSGTYASHAAFENLPGSARVIARGSQTDLPTLVEYDVGAGRVLALGQTLEFGFFYGQDAGRILENGVPYAYAFEPLLDVPWVSANPASGSVPPGGSLDIMVSVDTTGLAPGLYRARLALATSDPRNPEVQVPVTLLVPAYRQAVNAGDGTYIDLLGDEWAQDRAYSAGSWGYRNNRSRTKTTRKAIEGTEDDPLYKSQRSLPGEYRFDGLPPGVYQIELRFAELSSTMPGNRIFDVTIEGDLVLFAHDIADEVGNFAADDHSFFVAVTDGQANVRFVERRGYTGPVINAIRVTHRPDR